MNNIGDILKQKDRTFSFEVFPAKTPEGDINLIHKIFRELASLEPDFISCTYGAAGGNKDKTLAIVEHIQNAYSIPTMAHLTCISHTKEEICEIIKKIEKKGIKNVLALRGDPPKDNPKLSPGTDNYKHSSELVKYIRQYFKDDFGIGVAGFPECHPLSESKEKDLFYLKSKIDCGADFVITQLFFDNNLYFNYVNDAKNAGITKKIIPGILPVTSYSGLIKFCSTCGATIPQIVHDTFAPYENNPEKTVELGIEFAIKQCKELLANGAPGIHFYTLNKVYSVKKILEEIRN